MSPDPDGKIQRDEDSLIRSQVTLVPSRVRPGESTRVHISLTPNAELKALWNNEADPLRFWVDAPEGWQVSQQSHTIEGPENEPTSTEARHIDFEVLVSVTVSGIIELPVYALYFVCEDENGTCLYLRQDIDVKIQID